MAVKCQVNLFVSQSSLKGIYRWYVFFYVKKDEAMQLALFIQ